ncbi:cytochrome P450 [Aspergillus tanneri]|uniref:Cytochrome P450 n=1 Tax=Aspergillus tanneri TaxID=1220188 RepID=A0A5M9N718_9EURO|nr:uncharacterized protein ATNIH1004_001808 [Aspergillus tanneri]KAA8652899.1 hypothetical protein ATNIH1004_001808 [Aspergillus tanneri]
MIYSVPGSLIVFFLAVYTFRVFLSRHEPPLAPLPPGPKPWPIIGNLIDLPRPPTLAYEHFAKFKNLYGPISSITIFSQTFIVLNSHRLAVELLGKRSAKYSSRPHLEFAKELVGWKSFLLFLPHNDAFRAQRKAISREIGSKAAVGRFNNIQNVEVGRFLLRALKDPDGLLHHFRKQAAGLILRLGYGYIIEPHEDDPLVDLADTTLEQFSLTTLPVKYLPAWFPGAEFKKTAKVWRESLTAFLNKPYKFVKRQMNEMNYEPSFTSNLLRSGHVEPGSEEESVIKWSAAGLYAGGAETTLSTMSYLFLAMILYPEAQEKAQEEIDRVVGTHRLPRFEDRDKLPYINALVKEILRWHPVGAIGFPHQVTEDDICEGYFIPKGAQVLPIVWYISTCLYEIISNMRRSFTHDPDLYHDPMVFKPERFLARENYTPETNPEAFVFGFGRRICPGRILADSSLYLVIANFLAVFNISHQIKDGQKVPVRWETRPGIVSHPVPFNFSLKPRSATHEELVRTFEKEHPWESGHAKYL